MISLIEFAHLVAKSEREVQQWASERVEEVDGWKKSICIFNYQFLKYLFEAPNNTLPPSPGPSSASITWARELWIKNAYLWDHLLGHTLSRYYCVLTCIQRMSTKGDPPMTLMPLGMPSVCVCLQEILNIDGPPDSSLIVMNCPILIPRVQPFQLKCRENCDCDPPRREYSPWRRMPNRRWWLLFQPCPYHNTSVRYS